MIPTSGVKDTATRVQRRRDRDHARVRIDKTDLPKQRATVRIKCVYAVVFGSYEDNVVQASPWHVQSGNVQRLGVNRAINRENEPFPELHGIDVGRSKHLFIQILACSGQIIVIRENVLCYGRGYP